VLVTLPGGLRIEVLGEEGSSGQGQEGGGGGKIRDKMRGKVGGKTRCGG